MRIIPVLDLRSGRAVRAVGGDRAHYGPLRSALHDRPDPIGLARACRDRLGLRELYLADLDALAGAPPDLALYGRIASTGLLPWVDAGIREAADVPPLIRAGVATVVAGLETLRGPSALAEVRAEAGADRLVFSLDLRAGRPLLAPGSSWETADPEALAAVALEAGVRRLLLLDLADVGTGRGVGTRPLLVRLRASAPGVEIAVGGGIASAADLAPLAGAGASAVLVGSALHDGRIGPEAWDGEPGSPPEAGSGA